VGMVGFDVADGIGQSQTMNSLIATIQNVGGDSDVTPIDFATYSALDAVGALSLWRDARSPSPSTLAANLDASALTLTLTDGTAYPNAGIILIGREAIAYSGKAGNDLTIQRGAYGTTPAAHLAGENVQLAYTDPVTAPLTTLAVGAASGDVTLSVAAAARLIDPDGRFMATIRIADEIIGYRDITGTTLTGCTRGAVGSTAAAHAVGAAVENAVTGLLAGAITPSSTTIRILGRPFQPASPATEVALTLGSEVITYTGATDQGAGIWQLTGVVRGVDGTVPVAHANQDLVIFGRPGTFDVSVDSYVFLAALPTQTMVQNINFQDMPLSARLDDVDDFFLGATTSVLIGNGEDFRLRLAPREVFFSNSVLTDKSVTTGVVTVTTSASTVVLSDVGGTPGAAPGDTLTFTFERPVNPASIAAALVAGNTDNAFAAGSGSITGTLGGLVAELGAFSVPGTITASGCTMAMSSDQRRIVITLGTPAWPSGNYIEPGGTFTPDASVLDNGGNPFGGVFTVTGTFGVPDTDGDGLPDWWEALYPTAGNPAADTDGDGLSNLFEYWSGTNPTVADSDGDGTPDGEEDTDGDRLSNADEQRFGTRPDIRDTDDDGYEDGEELDPCDPLYSMSSPGATPRALNLAKVDAAGINVPQSGRFAAANRSWTIEAWIKLDTDTTGVIAQYLTTGSGRVAMELSLDGGVPQTRFETGAGVEYLAGGAASGIGAIPTGVWVHLAGVWSNLDRSLALYVNGHRMVAQHSVEFPAGTVGTLVLAAGFDDGALDEVRVWSDVPDSRFGARPQQDIVANMSRMLQEGVECPRGYWRFDDGGLDIEDFGGERVGGTWTAFMGDATYALDSALAGIISQDQDASNHADWVEDGTGTGTAMAGVTLTGYDDIDSDLLPDWYEHLYTRGASETSMLPTADLDNDGLNNLYEFLCDTNPYDTDTDNDGIADADEDFDGDGLSNGREAAAGTHPAVVDTDDDGLTDGEEVTGVDSALTPAADPAGRTSSPRNSLSPLKNGVLKLVDGAGLAGRLGGAQLTAPYTLEAWIRLNAAAANGVIMNKANEEIGGGVADWTLRLNGGILTLDFRAQDGTVRSAALDGVPLNTAFGWTHVAAVVAPDASSADHTVVSLYAYLEGTEYAAAVRVLGAAGAPSYGSFTLGGSAMPLEVDEVRLWNSARDADAIRGSRFAPVAATGMAAYYRFDDGGESIEDMTVPFNAMTNDAAEEAALLTAGNAEVVFYGLNKADSTSFAYLSADSDADGLFDVWELARFGNLTTASRNPAVTLVDGWTDSDGDGLNDRYEVLAGTDPTSATAEAVLTADADADGLSLLAEQAAQTDPANADTDDDGVLDGAELAGDPNPLDAVAGAPSAITNPRYSLARHDTLATDGPDADALADHYAFTPRRSLDLAAVSAAAPAHQGMAIPRSRRFDRGGGSMTFESWVFINGDDTGAILSYKVAAGTVLELGLAAGKPYAKARIGGADQTVTADTALAAGAWRHVAAIWDASASELKVSVDGLVEKSLAVTGSALSGIGTLTMAGDGTAAATLTDGYLDEVRVWGYARGLFQTNAQRDVAVDSQATGLLACWMFDDGGSTIEDFSVANPLPGAAALAIVPAAAIGAAVADANGDGAADWVTAAQAAPVRTERPNAIPNWWAEMYFEPATASNVASYNGHYYEYVTADVSWSAAAQDATSRGGYLAIINDRAENDILTNVLLRTSEGAWIGLTDEQTEGQWLWVDGTPIEAGFSQWSNSARSVEPNDGVWGNPPYVSEDYGQIVGRANANPLLIPGFWNDLRANDPTGDASGYIVEYGQFMTSSVAAEDADGDGLNNLYEFYCRTNPLVADTDGNGRPDGAEDADGDGLANLLEQERGSDPRLPDTDDDGLADLAEVNGLTRPDSSLSPLVYHAVIVDGSATSMVELPASYRFAL
ncbi:MAG: hypothetical protein GX595_06490, partial [Lentisphaerae bacterium]|nr:hypothetical protein [Lentisphaerota bacterium]